MKENSYKQFLLGLPTFEEKVHLNTLRNKKGDIFRLFIPHVKSYNTN